MADHNLINAGIDSKAKANGIGPGMPFAYSLLNKFPNFGVVGLVPCAASATQISQWAQGTKLYNRLVNRTKVAMQDGEKIEALLWYQGESDTTTESDANAYKGSLQKFITDLRTDLQLPTLLIIEVYI